MKQKIFFIALLCAGCTLVSYGQRKPTNTKPATKPAQSTMAPSTRQSSSHAATAIKPSNTEQLPEFEKSGGKPFMDVLRDRETVPNLQREQLQPQQLSQLLWVACGMTSPENSTAYRVTQMPCLEMYYINENGIYLYERLNHELISIRKGRYNNMLTDKEGQSTDATSAVFFVFKPGQLSPYGNAISETEAAINCGAIMQNIALYCSCENLACQAINFSDENKAELIKAINQPEAIIIYGLAIGRR